MNWLRASLAACMLESNGDGGVEEPGVDAAGLDGDCAVFCASAGDGCGVGLAGDAVGLAGDCDVFCANAPMPFVGEGGLLGEGAMPPGPAGLI